MSSPTQLVVGVELSGGGGESPMWRSSVVSLDTPRPALYLWWK